MRKLRIQRINNLSYITELDKKKQNTPPESKYALKKLILGSGFLKAFIWSQGDEVPQCEELIW